MKDYFSFEEHLHNFASWAASRAVQRRFPGSTAKIKRAIEDAGLKELINLAPDFSSREFDDFHKKTANSIIDFFYERGIIITYGQAAKIIAIYIKTIAVIRNSGKGNLARIAHPPIDRIMLTNIRNKFKDLELTPVNWTELSMNEYFEVINTLRKLEYDYFWELEKYWTIDKNEKDNHISDSSTFSISEERSLNFRMKLESAFGNNTKVSIPMQNGRYFSAKRSVRGIEVDNLSAYGLLNWNVFDEIEDLFKEKGSCVLKGNAMEYRLGESGLPTDCIEGRIAYKIYGKKQGDSVFRRITPIVNLLIWAKICKPGRSRYLELK